MSSTTLIYNVVALQGESEALKAIEGHYIVNHANRNGYLFNLRDWTSDWRNVAQTKRYLQLGKAFIDNLTLSLNLDGMLTDTAVNDIREDIAKYIVRLMDRAMDRKVHVSRPITRVLQYTNIVLNTDLSRVEESVCYNPDKGWLNLENIEDLKLELAKFHPSITEMIISTTDESEVDIDSDEYLYQSEEEWYWINYQCKPLMESDFETYLDETEDTQSYTFIDDKTLVFSTWSRGGDVSNLMEDLCSVYGLTATIISGNRQGSREMKVQDAKTLIMRTLKTEVPLQRCIEFLEPIAQLDNCIHWFGWTDKDVYPEVDDETFIATAPVGGLD